ncbi:MAG TPA: hypothetical protein VIV11_31600 [Kofleriaceae bacterium]
MRWVALIALLCAARSARADETAIGVVAVGETGVEREVAKRMSSWLRARGYTVSSDPLSDDATNTLTNCFTLDDLACARGVFDARSKTNTLVYVGVIATAKNITFNTYWFTKGKEALGERRVCEKCEGDAWHALTDKMMERLSADSRPVGKRPSRLGPVIVIGAGVATIAAGGIFLYYGSLGGPDQKYIYQESTPVGIALGAVGLGATLVGTIWLIQTGSSRSGPVATATRDGGYIGWTGHF